MLVKHCVWCYGEGGRKKNREQGCSRRDYSEMNWPAQITAMTSSLLHRLGRKIHPNEARAREEGKDTAYIASTSLLSGSPATSWFCLNRIRYFSGCKSETGGGEWQEGKVCFSLHILNAPFFIWPHLFRTGSCFQAQKQVSLHTLKHLLFKWFKCSSLWKWYGTSWIRHGNGINIYNFNVCFFLFLPYFVLASQHWSDFLPVSSLFFFFSFFFLLQFKV